MGSRPPLLGWAHVDRTAPGPAGRAGQGETAFRARRACPRVDLALTAVDLFGIVGLVTLLAGFLGNLMGRIPAQSALYSVLNVVGSGILAVYSVLIEAWVFFPLEVVWALAAAISLARGLGKKKAAPA